LEKGERQGKDTLGFLPKISFIPLLLQPQGCLWCPELKKNQGTGISLISFLAIMEKISTI
jgi:hypothetical protein